MKAIILAGGSGTRLWPLSRSLYPKQFLSLINDQSLLQLTANRLSAFFKPDEIYVVSPEEHKNIIISHLTELFDNPFTNTIIEPCPRNTAPAIALVIKHFLENKYSTPDDILLFCPADHLIEPSDKYIKSLQDAIENYPDKIITFGITPSKPETGYGYIEIGEAINEHFDSVNCFIEKPNIEDANKFVKSGKHLWNSGVFMFSIEVFLDELRILQSSLYEYVTSPEIKTDVFFKTAESISIDFAVMEKSKNILCKRLTVEWNDIGSWDALYQALPKDETKNVFQGDIIADEVKNSFVISKSKLIVLQGLSDVIVVEAEDAIFIANRKNSQDVRKIVNMLKDQGRTEIEENVTTYRPWGSYTILEKSDRYKIKKIIVEVGASLSLQRHAHRSEHWIVVKGTAEVQIGDEKKMIHENESVYVAKSVLHRLANPGKVPLEIIEVQNGEYVGEDDIERFEDEYNRI